MLSSFCDTSLLNSPNRNSEKKQKQIIVYFENTSTRFRFWCGASTRCCCLCLASSRAGGGRGGTVLMGGVLSSCVHAPVKEERPRGNEHVPGDGWGRLFPHRNKPTKRPPRLLVTSTIVPFCIQKERCFILCGCVDLSSDDISRTIKSYYWRKWEVIICH